MKPSGEPEAPTITLKMPPRPVLWPEAIKAVRSHVFRISTPRGSGTGFLIANGKNDAICAVATAAHVVDHAHYWEEPIRIEHAESGVTKVLRPSHRAVFLDEAHDTAAILFHREADLVLPADPLPMVPERSFVMVGNEIGWLGFPAIHQGVCFFTGRVSAWISNEKAYLVDGVAINGVSGGPAFHLGTASDPVYLAGVVSAYIPNRATGEVLPGLSVIRDVAQFHSLAPTFASLDEAKQAESPAEPPPPQPDVDGAAEVVLRSSR